MRKALLQSECLRCGRNKCGRTNGQLLGSCDTLGTPLHRLDGRLINEQKGLLFVELVARPGAADPWRQARSSADGLATVVTGRCDGTSIGLGVGNVQRKPA